MSLYIDAVPASDTLAFSSGVPLIASFAAFLIGSTCEMPSALAGSPSWEMMKRAA